MNAQHTLPADKRQLPICTLIAIGILFLLTGASVVAGISHQRYGVQLPFILQDVVHAWRQGWSNPAPLHQCGWGSDIVSWAVQLQRLFIALWVILVGLTAFSLLTVMALSVFVRKVELWDEGTAVLIIITAVYSLLLSKTLLVLNSQLIASCLP